MEQRRLRLGDILDDYCPRERRLTNHAVVAMIEEDVKQTRCTTCDAEHVYKGGKVPRRRKKDSPAALYKEVLAGMPDAEAPVPGSGHLSDAIADAGDEAAPAEGPVLVPVAARPVPEPDRPASQSRPSGPVPPTVDADESSNELPDVEDGPVHRPLIRAQLPRIEGHKEERRLPDFTIRQPGRGTGSFRGGEGRPRPQRPGGQGGQGGQGSNAGNGNRPHGGGRFAGPRPGGPGRSQPGRGGSPAGFRGAGQPRQGGPKKRSR